MLIFFLGALPTMLILAGILYYFLMRGKIQTKGKPTSSVYVIKNNINKIDTNKKRLQISDTKFISCTNPHVLSKSRELILTVHEK